MIRMIIGLAIIIILITSVIIRVMNGFNAGDNDKTPKDQTNWRKED